MNSKSFFSPRKRPPLRRLSQLALFCGLFGAIGCADDKSEAQGSSSTGSTPGASIPTSLGTAPSTQGPGSSVGTTGESGPTGNPTTSAPDQSGSPTDGSDTGKGGGQQPSQGLDALVDAACSWGSRCCDTGEFDFIYGTDAASCKSAVMDEIKDGPSPNEGGKLAYASALLHQLVTQVDLSRSELVPEAVTACLDHLKKRECLAPLAGNPASCQAAGAGAPCALDKLFRGRLNPGEQCNLQAAAVADIECGAKSSCKANPDAPSLGRCTSVVAKGQLCDLRTAGSNCDQGLFCSLQTGRCTEKAAAGESCAFEDPKSPIAGSETIPCAEGLSCSATTSRCIPACAEQTRCGAPSEEGEVAISGADELLCGSELSCIPSLIEATKDSEKKGYIYSCQAKLAEKGQCDSDKDCKTGLRCEIEANAILGECKARIAKDAKGCKGEDSRCKEGLICKDDTCIEKIKAGSDKTCEAHKECDEASLGCVGASEEKRRCIAKALPKDTDCVADYGIAELPAPQFASLVNTSGTSVLGANDFRFWANYCESRVCDQGKCAEGATENQACDLDIDNDSLPSCGFGLQCLSGLCKPMLKTGDSCKPESSTDTAACQIDSIGGVGNESACTLVRGEFRCTLRAPSLEGSYCDGK